MHMEFAHHARSTPLPSFLSICEQVHRLVRVAIGNEAVDPEPVIVATPVLKVIGNAELLP